MSIRMRSNKSSWRQSLTRLWIESSFQTKRCIKPKSVHLLAPIARLWYKEYAILQDLEYVLDHCKFPVGVEWQGLFEDMNGDDDDYGHYSIIAHKDKVKDEIIAVDP